MSLSNVSEDEQYRALVSEALTRAAREVGVEVVSVAFEVGENYDREAAYSWVCFVSDARANDRAAAMTISSATDHFSLQNPNGFLDAAGSQVAVTVHDIVTSSESAITVRGEDGKPVLFSPFMAHLEVSRAQFTYRFANAEATS